MRHFEFTGETKTNVYGVKLFQIRCTVAFGDVKVGDVGGWVEKEDNLSDNAWVYDNAQVFGNARVYGDAWVYGNARVCGNARVYGDAQVCDNAWVYGNARVCGDALVCGYARVLGDAWVCDNADYCCFQCFGSANRTTTVFRTEAGIRVSCGCFFGSLDEFAQAVEKTHGDNKYGRAYKAMIELIKVRFSE